MRQMDREAEYAIIRCDTIIGSCGSMEPLVSRVADPRGHWGISPTSTLRLLLRTKRAFPRVSAFTVQASYCDLDSFMAIFSPHILFACLCAPYLFIIVGSMPAQRISLPFTLSSGPIALNESTAILPWGWVFAEKYPVRY